MLDEKDFKSKCDKVYKTILDAFETIDPDDAEAYFHLDNITITFKVGTRFVVNRQTPARQIWLATKRSGLHFNYDSADDSWKNDKTREDFYETLSMEVSRELGRNITISSQH